MVPISASISVGGPRVGFAAVLLGALLGALACSGSGLNLRPLPVTANPGEAVGRLASSVDLARSESVDMLSPEWFEKADESLERAKATREEGGSIQEVLDAVAEGTAQLERAQELAKVSRTALPKVIEARQAARTAGATEFGGAYEAAQERFLGLTRAVETDDLSWARKREGGVVNAFRELELRAIEETTLGEVRRLVAEARADGAAELAPAALASADQMLLSTEDFIAKDRYDSEGMQERASEALFYANRAVAITREIRRQRQLSQEARVLETEILLSRLSEELSLADLRNTSFENQRRSVIQGVAEVRKDRDFLVSQTEKLRGHGDMLRIELAEKSNLNEQLEAERRFNRLYAEVSAYFEGNEAEVYKKDQRLVVRLRGIQFPVGQAVVGPENYALLSKVQRAVRAFGDPGVTVEGHTDSTGSAALNDYLSQERAQAVVQYLVANNTVRPDRIRAVGKGPSDPLAPNTTAEGRALNRRIDVVIDASMPAAVGAR